MLFLGGIELKAETRTKGRRNERQREFLRKEKFRVDQFDFLNKLRKGRKYALRKLTKDKFLLQYELSNDFYKDTVYL